MSATNAVREFRIRKSYVQLLRHLQPSKILPELFQEEILDLDDIEEVNAEKTRKKRAEKLVNMILQSGKEKALPAFVKSLQNSHHRLAQLLHEPVSGENASYEQEDEVTAERDNPSPNASEEGANGRSADVSFYSDSSTESEMSVCNMEM